MSSHRAKRTSSRPSCGSRARRHLVSARAAVAALAAVWIVVSFASAQISGLRGLKDHSQCCAIGMPSIHGTDGSFDPAPDPILSRYRAPAPPPPAGAKGVPITPAPTEFPPLKFPTSEIDGHIEAGFDLLGGYAFTLSEKHTAAFAADDVSALASVEAQIPELVRRLDGRKVLVTGFMLPMKMDGPLTTEFLLVANSLLCCYGVVPPMNQWIAVKMTKAGVKPQQDVPIQIFGTLRVQPRVENGALAAIYHLEADRQRKN